MHHDERAGAHELDAEIAVGHAVEAVFADGGEAELLRLKDAVGRVRRPGQGTAADGGGVHAPAGVGKAAIVALQHHGVGQQLLAEGDGLRALQVGVARHDGILVGARLRVQGRDDGQHERLQRGDLVFQIQPQVKRDLIVARAGGMQLFADVADAAGELGLDEHVDVLGLHVELQRAGLQVREDPGQTANDLVGVRLRQDAAFGEHGGVGHGAGDVLLVHPAVNGDGGVESVGQRRSLRLRPARPKFVHSVSFLMKAQRLPFQGSCQRS